MSVALVQHRTTIDAAHDVVWTRERVVRLA